jgi:hypothetical protein
MAMDLDGFLSQPPAPVEEQGFTRRVMLMLYQKRVLQRNVVSTFVTCAALALVVLLPVGVLVAELPLQLAALITSPWIPWVAAGVAMLLLTLRPRRFCI